MTRPRRQQPDLRRKLARLSELRWARQPEKLQILGGLREKAVKRRINQNVLFPPFYEHEEEHRTCVDQHGHGDATAETTNIHPKPCADLISNGSRASRSSPERNYLEERKERASMAEQNSLGSLYARPDQAPAGFPFPGRATSGDPYSRPQHMQILEFMQRDIPSFSIPSHEATVDGENALFLDPRLGYFENFEDAGSLSPRLHDLEDFEDASLRIPSFANPLLVEDDFRDNEVFGPSFFANPHITQRPEACFAEQSPQLGEEWWVSVNRSLSPQHIETVEAEHAEGDYNNNYAESAEVNGMTWANGETSPISYGSSSATGSPNSPGTYSIADDAAPVSPRSKLPRAQEKAFREDYVKMMKRFYGENWTYAAWKKRISRFDTAGHRKVRRSSRPQRGKYWPPQQHFDLEVDNGETEGMGDMEDNKTATGKGKERARED